MCTTDPIIGFNFIIPSEHEVIFHFNQDIQYCIEMLLMVPEFQSVIKFYFHYQMISLPHMLNRVLLITGGNDIFTIHFFLFNKFKMAAKLLYRSLKFHMR